MPYSVKSNPDQMQENLVMMPLVGSGDPLNAAKKVLARFRTSFDNTVVTAIDRIYINAVSYPFATSRATTTAAGIAGIISEINTIMTTLLGNNDGTCVVSISGTKTSITTSFCELKLEKAGDGTNYGIFLPTDAIIEGTEDANVASPVIHIGLNAAGTDYEVRVKPVAGKSISAFVVNWAGSTAEYTAAWPKPASYTLPAGTTIVDGYVRFLVVKATGDTGAVLAVSITPTGGSAIAYSQTVKLNNHNGI